LTVAPMVGGSRKLRLRMMRLWMQSSTCRWNATVMLSPTSARRMAGLSGPWLRCGPCRFACLISAYNFSIKSKKSEASSPQAFLSLGVCCQMGVSLNMVTFLHSQVLRTLSTFRMPDTSPQELLMSYAGQPALLVPAYVITHHASLITESNW